MAGLDDDFAFVAASAVRAARLQRAPCRAVLEDEAFGRSHGLAGHLDLAYAAIEARVESRRADFAAALDDSVKQDAVVEIRRLTLNIRNLQSNLAWLDAATQPPLDLGTRYYVEDAARSLVGPDAEVTIVAAEHISYATTSDPYEPLINDWGSGMPSPAPIVVVVFIPRREEHSGLLHPLIVHELGHAADSARGIVDGIWAEARNRTRLSRRFSVAAIEFAAAENVDPREATDHIADRLRSWIAECLCDAVATHHLGPTYLYAFIAEVLAGSLDEPGPRHPPPRLRIRHIVAQLDRLGWTSVLSAGDAVLDQWVRALVADQPEYAGVTAFLTWAVDDLHAVVRNAADRLVGRRVFQPDGAELADVSMLLSAGIPPAQRQSGQAVSRESIMLCCWHAALRREGGGPAAVATAPDAEELSEILPAALELGALVNAWA